MDAIAQREWKSCPVCGERVRTPFVHFDALGFDCCDACRVVYKTYEKDDVRAAGFYEAPYHTGK